MIDPNEFATLSSNAEKAYSAGRQTSTRNSTSVKKKSPGGLKGFVINNLPSIAGGAAAVAAAPLNLADAFTGVGGTAAYLGSIGAASAGGEALKRKLLGEKQSLKESAIQGVEGAALGGAGKALKGVSGVSKGILKTGAKSTAATTEKEVSPGVIGRLKTGLQTQGQQMQARGLGMSGGAKVAGKELQPQDTERMLKTLNDEGVTIGNANSTSRDVNTKLKGYGQQIADHFKQNNAPLHPEDTDKIAANFLTSFKTTDPRMLKEAHILADDLKKNVKDTKGMWDFRKSLDSRIPDTKFMDSATSNKVAALKDMRSYLSKELGNVPAMKNYHALSEIKPFLGKGMRELNQPSGGVIGRVLSSGPVQKAEQLAGKATEAVGNIGTREVAPAIEESTKKGLLDKVLVSKGIPVSFEDSIYKATPRLETKSKVMVNPSVGEVDDAQKALKGYSTTGKIGKTSPNTDVVAPDFTPINNYRGGGISEPVVAMKGTRTALPLEQSGSITRGIINTPDVYKEIEQLPIPEEAKAGILARIASSAKNAATLPVRAAVAPIAYPGKSALQVGKQVLGRGAGIPAALSQAEQEQSTAPDALQNTDQLASDITDQQQPSDDPFAPENAQASVAKILAQGGDMKDVAAYLSNVKALQDLSASSAKPLNATQQQQANNANSGLQDISSLSQMLSKDPSIAAKSSLPGGSIAQRLTGTTDYVAARNNIIDVISRLRSGAAISTSEEKLYKSLLPAAGDTSDSANAKLDRLATLLGSFANQTGGTSDAADALSSLGY